MTSEFTSRFSDEELDKCQSWSLPDVSSSKLLPSAEKEKADRNKNKSISLSTKVSVKNKNSDSISEDDEVIEDVAADSVSMQPLTAEQLKEITEAAEKEGYDAGYKKGFTEGETAGNIAGKQHGLQGGQQIIAEQSERLQHLMDALLIPLESEQNLIEKIILDMVCQLAKAVIEKELVLDSSQITQLVRNAVQSLPSNTEKFTLYLNPQDSELIKEHMKTVDKKVLYQIDDELLPGGCRLEAKHSSIDATVEKRMQNIIDGFLNKRFTDAQSGQEKNIKLPDTDNQHAKKTAQNVGNQQQPAMDAKPDNTVADTPKSED
ncbi:MAG: flagellar assembly protein FliH [Pseudomonadota bacterium]